VGASNAFLRLAHFLHHAAGPASARRGLNHFDALSQLALKPAGLVRKAVQAIEVDFLAIVSLVIILLVSTFPFLLLLAAVLIVDGHHSRGTLLHWLLREANAMVQLQDFRLFGWL